MKVGWWSQVSLIARRSVALAGGSLAVLSFLFLNGTRGCVQLLLYESNSYPSCRPRVSVPPSHEFLFLAGVIALGSAVLWVGPWRPIVSRSLRRRSSLRLRRRLRASVGVLLIGVGVVTVLSSIAGLFVTNDYSFCGWYELWCEDGALRGVLPSSGGSVREGWFAIPRLVSVGFGIATAWWGTAEVRGVSRHARTALAAVVGSAGLLGVAAAIFADSSGYGWRGLGVSQVAGIVFSCFLLLLASAIDRAPPGPFAVPSEAALFNAAAAAIALGAWTVVLARTGTDCLPGSFVGTCVGGIWAPIAAGPMAAAGICLAWSRRRTRVGQRAELLAETEILTQSDF